MNDTVKEILGLLDNGKPELQVAAAQVLGELRPKDAQVCKALEQGLGKSLVLGRYALEALAKLGTPDALRIVARSVWEHEGLADQAAVLLADKGAASHAAIAHGWEQAPQEKRGRLLGILGKSLSPESLDVCVRALFQPDLTEQAVQVLVDARARFDAALHKRLREQVTARLNDVPLPDACVAKILLLLGRLDAAGARTLLLKYCGDKFPLEIRAAALRGLCGQKLTDAQVKDVLAVLEDGKLQPLHDAARELLTALPEWSGASAAVLKKLLASRQPEQKLFALRALRNCPSTEVAKLAIKFLRHQDARYRQAAAVALGANKFAIEPLLKLLQVERDVEQARLLGGILVQLGPLMTPKLVRSMAERAVKLMGNGSIAGDLLFDISLGVGGAKIAPFFVERAIRLRRLRRYEEALHVLARLLRTPHLGAEGQYQLALTRLLLDLSRPMQESTQPGNPTMGFFAVMVRDGFPLGDRLRKESALPPEALLRIATHFVGSVAAERRFGADLLQHLATRGKGRAGEEAKLVLRTAGV